MWISHQTSSTWRYLNVATYWTGFIQLSLTIRCILSISERPGMESDTVDICVLQTVGRLTRGNRQVAICMCQVLHHNSPFYLFLRTAVYCGAGYIHTNTHTNKDTHLLLCVCSLNRVLQESVSVYCLSVPLSVLPDVYLSRTMDCPGKTWAREVWSCVCVYFLWGQKLDFVVILC